MKFRFLRNARVRRVLLIGFVLLTVLGTALFLHGTEDPRARVGEARQVFEAVAGPKHFQSFPQLGHEAALRHPPEAWQRAINPFLRTVE
jgi:pimeloyl-ACP methyl ester carboxylesterase